MTEELKNVPVHVVMTTQRPFLPMDILRWLMSGYAPDEQKEPLKSSMSRVKT